MQCPYCHSENTKVVDSRKVKNNTGIRRRRECPECNLRFTTYEFYESTPLLVIKKDGEREIFDKQKIIAGILRASYKCSVTLEVIDKLVTDVENELQNRFKEEVRTAEIGRLVMNYLKGLDEIAYIRFASVYRKFSDLQEFSEALEKLKKEKKYKKKK
ncbi:transcriptional repressor NrdR [Candidatus Dependentiae bacterium]|nr:transcriptional repressor NrdR [Candidatus Dependentiae bacterium]